MSGNRFKEDIILSELEKNLNDTEKNTSEDASALNNENEVAEENTTANSENADALNEEGSSDLSNGEAAAQEQPAEYVPQFGDISGEQNQAIEEQPKKKKSFIMPTVIVALAIVLVAAIGAGVYLLFFNSSIVGTWALPATDGSTQTTYLVFDNDGKAKMVVGSMEVIGTYKMADASEASETPLSIAIAYNINGSFGYKIEGNIFTGKTLTLTNSSMTEDVVLNSANLPANVVSPKPDNKMDDALMGKWNIADYGISYTFNNDGTMIMESEEMKVTANYSAKDGSIKIDYIASSEQTLDLTYTIDGDILVLDGTMAFVREGSDATVGQITQPQQATAATQADTQADTQGTTGETTAATENTTQAETKVPTTTAA